MLKYFGRSQRTSTADGEIGRILSSTNGVSTQFTNLDLPGVSKHHTKYPIRRGARNLVPRPLGRLSDRANTILGLWLAAIPWWYTSIIELSRSYLATFMLPFSILTLGLRGRLGLLIILMSTYNRARVCVKMAL